MNTEELRKFIAAAKDIAVTKSWEHAAIRLLCMELEAAKNLTSKQPKHKDLTPSLFDNIPQL